MSRVAAIGLAACAAVVPARLATMRDQADVLEHAGDGMSTVKRSELAAGETIEAEASVPGERTPMILRGTIGGKLCFTRNADISVKDGERDRIVHRYEAARYAFTFYKTLGEITAQTAWPEPADRFEVSVLEGRDLTNRCHATEHRTFCGEGHEREMTVQLCTNAPAMAADAGYLGLALVFDDASQNRLVAWKLAP